jgi:hypothetical protein
MKCKTVDFDGAYEGIEVTRAVIDYKELPFIELGKRSPKAPESYQNYVKEPVKGSTYRAILVLPFCNPGYDRVYEAQIKSTEDESRFWLAENDPKYENFALVAFKRLAPLNAVAAFRGKPEYHLEMVKENYSYGNNQRNGGFRERLVVLSPGAVAAVQVWNVPGYRVVQSRNDEITPTTLIVTWDGAELTFKKRDWVEDDKNWGMLNWQIEQAS